MALRPPCLSNPTQTPEGEGLSRTGSETALIENGDGFRVAVLLLQGIDLSQDIVRGFRSCHAFRGRGIFTVVVAPPRKRT